jgi:hypothetical protein
MRNLKLALAGTAALILAASSANALEVKKKINALAQPPKIWETVGEFCAIKDWHPLVADCKEAEEEGATFRTLTLKNGGSIKEKLIASDDTSYSYEIVEGPLPVKNYQAKLWIEEDAREPDRRTTIHWDATFDANGASDEDAEKTIADIFLTGLKSIKQKVMPPEGAE